MSILARYLIGTVLLYSTMVIGVFLTLGGLFVFIGQQDDIGVGDYGAADALLFSILNLPQQAYEVMPISVLLGSLLGLGALARGSELVVVRASGVSVKRVAAWVAAGGLILMLAALALGEYIAPPLQKFARQQKAFSKFADVSFASSGSAWVKDGNMMISVEEQTGANLFGGLFVFRFEDPQKLASVTQAARATVAEDGRQWQLEGYRETRFNDERIEATRTPRGLLTTRADPSFLGLAVSEPRQLPSLDLLRLVDHLRANGLETRAYEFAFWSRIARVCAIVLAAMLAVPFAFGPLRTSGAGARLVIGVLIGIVFFLMQRMLESGAIVFDVKPIVLAWIPTAALALLTVGLVARTR
jgi:lipopolysaccharide export system permease protein